jgi:hypothetical protein
MVSSFHQTKMEVIQRLSVAALNYLNYAARQMDVMAGFWTATEISRFWTVTSFFHALRVFK